MGGDKGEGAFLSLKTPNLPLSQPASLAPAEVLGAACYHVVVDEYVYGGGGRGNPLGQSHFRFTGKGLACGIVMHEYDGAGVVPECLFYYRSGRDIHGGESAFVHLLHA